MAAQQNLPRLPSYVKFRVLIIGRANAGKTTILQRVCNTTESPVISRYNRSSGTREQIQHFDPSMERGEHNIDDEYTFTKHDGYVFHDSRGFEAGSEEELKIVQDFVRRRSQESKLNERLHAIWFCVPMDNDRPSLELKHFDKICPDKNVPVIAVFTKYDQYRRDIKIKLEDQGIDTGTVDLNAEMERIFEEQCLSHLWGSPPFVRLEKMHKKDQRCTELIDKTANKLSGGAAALMLLAVQKDNLELSIKQAVRRAHSEIEQGKGSTERIIKTCIVAFPWLWLRRQDEQELFFFQFLGDDDELELGFGEELRFELQRQQGGRGFFGLDEVNTLFSKLGSFFGNPPLLISNDDHIHHKLIVVILILEHACLSYASQSKPTKDEALDEAYSQYCASGIHNELTEQFSAPPQRYSILQFTEFILTHHL